MFLEYNIGDNLYNLLVCIGFLKRHKLDKQYCIHIKTEVHQKTI